MFNDTYYQELFQGADFFTKNDEAISLLNRCLDDRKYKNQKSKRDTISL